MRSTDNLTLGFQSFGDPQKQTVAIVHGWATDSHFLLPFVEIFKDYHVMLIDMPGYGMSEHLKQFSISIRQQANLILNTIPKHTILVSWSLGTLAASVACYNDLDKKVDKFISICGTPRFPCDPNWPGFDYRYVLKSLQLFDEGRNTRSLKLFFNCIFFNNATCWCKIYTSVFERISTLFKVRKCIFNSLKICEICVI